VDAPAAVVRETHVSTIILVGDRAYKLKKAVHFPFVDLSTPERRGAVCRREVELNRRLAPDVYLGVADIVGPAGEVCDHLVVMRRMPEDRRLSTLVSRGEIRDGDLVAVARQIAAFHAHAARSPRIDSAASVDALRDRWEAGFAETAPFVGDVLDPDVEHDIEHLARRYLNGRADLFADRIVAGRVVDGHGDLLADDVFLLADGPRILDCLEFDDQLRFGDVLADVAFLAMDLLRLDAKPASARFLAAYRELSGETGPVSLEHHYVALRAHIRAKVACLRDDAASRVEARRLHELARSQLRAGRVVLTLVGGDPGSGKSTLAAGVSDRTGGALLRSDEVRKDLLGLGHGQPAASALDRAAYAPSVTAAAYRDLLVRAELLLRRGESVVLDATWGDAARRADARAVARATASDLVELRCSAPAAIREERVVRRARDGTDPSDATVDVARELSARAAPWPTAFVIDTAGDRGYALGQALRAIDASPRQTGSIRPC
jgi:aminoglycoside phosphotransferase family enzyme/predicted kinase